MPPRFRFSCPPALTAYTWPWRPSCPATRAVPRARRVRPTRVPDLALGTRCRSAPGLPAADRTVRAMDAREPPVQAVDGQPPTVGRDRVLPDLRHRRRPAIITGRACPPTQRPRRVTDAEADPPAIRSDTHRRPALEKPERLRPGPH